MLSLRCLHINQIYNNHHDNNTVNRLSLNTEPRVVPGPRVALMCIGRDRQGNKPAAEFSLKTSPFWSFKFNQKSLPTDIGIFITSTAVFLRTEQWRDSAL